VESGSEARPGDPRRDPGGDRGWLLPPTPPLPLPAALAGQGQGAPPPPLLGLPQHTRVQEGQHSSSPPGQETSGGSADSAK